MMPPPKWRETFRFGDFALDVSAYELRCHGRSVRLERRPMDLLILLLERRGQLVSRSDIVERLWGTDVFVDVEAGVNTVMWKLRGALHDSPDAPTFVETVPGKGYRFVAAIDVLSEPREERPAETADPPGRAQPREEAARPVALSPLPSDTLAANQGALAASTGVVTRSEAAPADRRTWARLTVAFLAVVLLAALVAWAWLGGIRPGPRITVAVLPFENLGGDPEREYLATGRRRTPTRTMRISRDGTLKTGEPRKQSRGLSNTTNARLRSIPTTLLPGQGLRSRTRRVPSTAMPALSMSGPARDTPPRRRSE